MTKLNDLSKRLALPVDTIGEITELRVVGGLDDSSPTSDTLTLGPQKVEVDAVVFRQSKAKRPLAQDSVGEANANFSTFRPRDLKRLAKSFKGRPFLRDHERGDLLARGGTILRSELQETATHFEIRQTLELVKPWAIEAAMDGTLETFSIGWDPPMGDRATQMESVRCTVCKCSLFSSDCPHLPGDVAKVAKSDEQVIVEAEFSKPQGAEVSGVSFPAVQGTQIEGIRQALSEARKQHTARKPKGMQDKTLKRLGLSADATPEDIESAIAALESKAGKVEDLETKLEAERMKATASADKLEEIRAAREKEAQEAADKRLSELHASALGRTFIAGSKQEEMFLKLAAKDLDEAEEFVKCLAPATPVGEPMQAASSDRLEAVDPMAKALASEGIGDGAIMEAAKKTLKVLGVSAEQVEKFGPNAVAANYSHAHGWLKSSQEG